MAVTVSSGDGYSLYNGQKVLTASLADTTGAISLDGMTVVEWDGDTTDLTVAGTMALISEKTPDTGKAAAYSTIQTDGAVYLSGTSESGTLSSDGYYYWGSSSLLFRYYPSASGTVTTPGIYANTPTGGVELSSWLFAFYEGEAATYETQYAVTSAGLIATADAIRAKTGGTAQIPWSDTTGFADAVEQIAVGGVNIIQVESAEELPTESEDGTIAIVGV